MQKEKIRNSILGILAFVLLFYEIICVKGRKLLSCEYGGFTYCFVWLFCSL